MKKCPSCQAMVNVDMSRCPYCGASLAAAAEAPIAVPADLRWAGADDPTTVVPATEAADEITPPTGIPVTEPDATVLAPLAASVAAAPPPPPAPLGGDAPFDDEDKRDNRGLWLLGALALVVVVLIGLVVVKYAGERNEPKLAGNDPSPTTAPTTARPTVAGLTAVPTNAAPAATTIQTPTAATTARTTGASSTPTTAPTTATTATTRPTTTVAAPASTVGAAPVTAAPGTAEARSLALSQQLATALATGDWATARTLEAERAKWTDQQFLDGYGDLDSSTVVPVSARQIADGRYQVKMVLVAQRTVKGSRVTSLFCGDWLVDPVRARITEMPNQKTLATKEGWLDPRGAAQPYLSACA